MASAPRPRTAAPPAFAQEKVDAGVSRQDDKLNLEIAIPVASFPRFPSVDPLIFDLCVNYEDQDAVGEKGKLVSNCKDGGMIGDALKLPEDFRKGLKLKPPEDVTALEAARGGWLGWGVLHYPVWVEAEQPLTPESLRSMVSTDSVDPEKVGLNIPESLTFSGGGKNLLTVVSGKDPYAVEGKCDSEQELRLGLYLISGKGQTGQSVLEWPAATCALGRAALGQSGRRRSAEHRLLERRDHQLRLEWRPLRANRTRKAVDAVPQDTKKSLYMMTLGCPKNRVDSEVMLGTLQAARLHAGARARRGRGHRRQHLRLHRPGQAGVGRHHPRDGRATRSPARCSTLVVTGCLSQRYGERAAPRRCPRSTTSSAPAPTRRSATCSPPRRAPRQVIPDPDYIHDARTPRVNSMPAVHRVPEDLRGLRQRLRLLHHPQAARRPALAPHRGHRRRGDAASRTRACRSSTWSRRT